MSKAIGGIGALGAAIVSIVVLFALKYLVPTLSNLEALRVHQEKILAVQLRRTERTADFISGLQDVGTVFAWGLAGVLLAFGAVFVASLAVARWQKSRLIYPADNGIWPIVEVPLGRGVKALHDPNMGSGATAVFGPEGVKTLDAPHPLEFRALVSGVQKAAALPLSPRGWPNRATWNEVSGRNDMKMLQQARAAHPTQPELPAPPMSGEVRVLNVKSAVALARPDRLIVGQNLETGAEAVVNLNKHNHVGIVGATGTGKTIFAGFTFAADVLAAGCGLTILDPDGGIQWGEFRDVAEWSDTDAYTLPDQLEAVYREYERRRKLLAEVGVGHAMQLDPSFGVKPHVVMIEEWGDLYGQLTVKQQAHVDRRMESLLARARKTWITLCLIDQAPHTWSPLLLTNIKRIIAFKMTSGQGQKVGSWHIGQLADEGEFMIPGDGRTVYKAFDTRHRMPSLLRMLPHNDFPRLMDAVASPVASPENAVACTVAPEGSGYAPTSGGYGVAQATAGGASGEDAPTRAGYVAQATEAEPGPEEAPDDLRGRIELAIAAVERETGEQAEQAAVRAYMREKGWGGHDGHKGYVRRVWLEYYGHDG